LDSSGSEYGSLSVCCRYGIKHSGSIKETEIFDHLRNYQRIKKGLFSMEVVNSTNTFCAKFFRGKETTRFVFILHEYSVRNFETV